MSNAFRGGLFVLPLIVSVAVTADDLRSRLGDYFEPIPTTAPEIPSSDSGPRSLEKPTR